MNSARTTRAQIAAAILGMGLAALWASAGCSSDSNNNTTKQPTKKSDAGDCFGSCASIGSEGAGGPHFTDTAGCLDYLVSLGNDQWGRPISDPETQCACDKCESWHVRCQNNLGCRDIAECALQVGCRTIRECFYGENWPGAQAGHGPCYDVIDKWGEQSTSAALGEAISQCSTPVCPPRNTPMASLN